MMDNEEDKLHKSDNLEGRLRLKKSYKESIDDKAYPSCDSNNEYEKNGSISTSQIPCENDSILDFKSPKKYMLRRNINNNKLSDKAKKKVPHTKIKIISNKKESDSNRLLQNRKNLHDTQQPSIESSFFKNESKVDSSQIPANVKTAYVCPLCFKNLKDESAQAIHMKSCAIKHNVSTKKLLDAVELQERQGAERKSLGLLSAPVLQDKKKSVPRKATLDDSDLQLALALSKSLYEKEEMEMLDEAEIIAISSNPSDLPDSKKEFPHRITLQNFGFVSNKSTSPTNNYPINKTKRKKHIEPTILQRRTPAEREHILTERIAEILMDYKDFTQNIQEEDKQSVDVKEKIVIKSQLLQQLRKTENTLWDRTQLLPSQTIFYVTQLSPQILSFPKKEHKLNEEQNVMKLTIQSDKETLTKELLEVKEMQIVDVTDSSEELTISLNAVKTCCEERRFLDTLAMNWRNILNDSSASDIVVLVKHNRHIWVHKLVFYVRCTNILLDVISNDTEFSITKEKICWVDIDYDVALAFLEFIYCGAMDKYSKVLNSETSLFAIRSLARKYKVNDLFVYLRQKKLESNLIEAESDEDTKNVTTNTEETLNISKLGKFTCNSSLSHTLDNLNNTQCAQKILLQEDTSDILQSLENNSMLVEDTCIIEDKAAVSTKSPERVNSRNNMPTNRDTSISPDIFDDTPDVIKRNDKSAIYSIDHEDSNINVLLSLIKQNADVNICSQKLSARKTDDAKYSELSEDTFTYLKNKEQSIMEIDLDSDLNSLKPSIDSYKNSLMDTPQSSKMKTAREYSPNVAGQKGDFTLYIEKIQRKNIKSDIDSDLDITTYPDNISRIRRSNPFRRYKCDDSDNEDAECNNLKQSNKTRKKLGKLSIIEQHMRSFADKNPEFYSNLSNKYISQVNQINYLLMSPERMSKCSHNNAENYSQNVILIEKDVNISNQVTITPRSAIHSPHTKTTNQTLNESIYDLVADEKEDEKEISMYSKYMRNHHDNSIAKYRAAIERNISDGNLSNESTLSDIPNKDSDINKNSNKSHRENIIDSHKTTNDVNHCNNFYYQINKFDSNAMSLTQSSTNIRKLKRKSLSEGQINISGFGNKKGTSRYASAQFQCNGQNIENIIAMSKIINKNVTPPPDYDGMRTPELHREMGKYGLKVQKRRRAIKLLNYIYNELHPLIPLDKISTEEEVAEISSDEGPPAKKPNTNNSRVKKTNNAEENDNELPGFQDSDDDLNSIKSIINKEMEFYETKSLQTLENSTDIGEAFTKLINVDKDLHNKILRYEPVNIEKLHATLRSHGFKCKLSNFMDYLDEQCITFYMPEQSMKNRTRKKT